MLQLHRLLMVAAGGAAFEEGEVPIPDVRTYDDVSDVGSVSESFTPLTTFGTDLYGRVIAATPGLVHFWRFREAVAALNGSDTTYAPYFLNSAGSAMLGKIAGAPTHGDPITATGLGSIRLNNGHLWAFDYFTQPGAHEVGSFEAWFKPLSLPSDGAVCGQWDDGVGWVILLGPTGTIGLTVGGQSMAAPGTPIEIGETYHVVGVIGGTQVPDYVSRLYINGVEVATHNFTGDPQLYTQNDQFRVGSYSDGAGSAWDGEVSEIAIYSRMLQPDEVYQHYQAGLGVLWP